MTNIIISDVDEIVISYELWLEVLSRMPPCDGMLYYYIGVI